MWLRPKPYLRQSVQEKEDGRTFRRRRTTDGLTDDNDDDDDKEDKEDQEVVVEAEAVPQEKVL